MADSQGFSHITVTPDDDDDVVIWAGASEEAADESPAEADESAGDEPAAEEPIDEEPAAQDEPTEEEAEVADALGVVDDVADAVARPQKAAAADGYHETTLDDLTSTKMSTTQKAVILVAVLGIIAFVVWYFLAS